jgi:hypothetical protein
MVASLEFSKAGLARTTFVAYKLQKVDGHPKKTTVEGSSMAALKKAGKKAEGSLQHVMNDEQ